MSIPLEKIRFYSPTYTNRTFGHDNGLDLIEITIQNYRILEKICQSIDLKSEANLRQMAALQTANWILKSSSLKFFIVAIAESDTDPTIRSIAKFHCQQRYGKYQDDPEADLINKFVGNFGEAAWKITILPFPWQTEVDTLLKLHKTWNIIHDNSIPHIYK